MDVGNVAEVVREKPVAGRVVFCGDGYERGTYEVHLERCGGLGEGIGLVIRHRGSQKWLIFLQKHPGDYQLIDHRSTRQAAGLALRDRPWDRKAEAP